MADVHVSGHACKEELRLMLQLTKPKFFIPVHGEYRHLVMHARLAKEMGVNPENIFVADCGDIVELTVKRGRIAGEVTAGNVIVDGIGDVGDVVLKDRKLLSQDGLVVAVLVINRETGALLAPPELISRGFVYMRESEELIAEAVKLLTNAAKPFQDADKSEYAIIKNAIRGELKSFLKKKTKRTPMIVPIVMEV